MVASSCGLLVLSPLLLVVAISLTPNAYRQFENEVTLPLHTRLSDEDVEYVIGNFVDIISK